MIPSNRVRTRNYEFVEVTTGAANTNNKLKIGDIEVLRGKKVKSITAFRVADVPKSPNGSALVNAAVFGSSFALIRILGKDRLNQVPLADFVPGLNDGRRWEFPYPVELDLSNSFVVCGDKASFVANEVYLLYFEFEEEVELKK